jgi:hypothetical protein
VFLHSVGSVGHVVQSRASEARNIKICVLATGGICGSLTTFGCVGATKHQRTIFYARVGLLQISQKAHHDTLCQTCIFASGGICGSHSAFWCVQGVKRRHLFFMVGWPRCCFHKKVSEIHYAELVFFTSGEFCGSHSAFRCI